MTVFIHYRINIASYWSGNETALSLADSTNSLSKTDLFIRLCFQLADGIFIQWQISSGSSRNTPGMSASVSTVVTEAWSVEKGLNISTA